MIRKSKPSDFTSLDGVRPLGLSIIVPAFNEEKTICRVICDLVELNCSFSTEIIVLNDGSTDRTNEIILQPKHIFHITYVNNLANRGKGNVVREGFLMARYSHVLIFDADLEYFATDIPLMFAPIQKGLTNVVFGSRIRGVNTMQPSFIFSLGRQLMTLYINLLFGSALTDLHTCFKLIPVDYLIGQDLVENGFGLDTEITCLLLKNQAHPFEIPITYIGRTSSQGKKIGLLDALICVKIITMKRVTRPKRSINFETAI